MKKFTRFFFHPIESALEAVEKDKHVSAIVILILLFVASQLHRVLYYATDGFRPFHESVRPILIFSLLLVIAFYPYSWLSSYPMRVLFGEITSRQFRIISAWVCGPLLLCMVIASGFHELSAVPVWIGFLVTLGALIRALAAVADTSLAQAVIALLISWVLIATLATLLLNFLGGSVAPGPAGGAQLRHRIPNIIVAKLPRSHLSAVMAGPSYLIHSQTA